MRATAASWAALLLGACQGAPASDADAAPVDTALPSDLALARCAGERRVLYEQRPDPQRPEGGIPILPRTGHHPAITDDFTLSDGSCWCIDTVEVFWRSSATFEEVRAENSTEYPRFRSLIHLGGNVRPLDSISQAMYAATLSSDRLRQRRDPFLAGAGRYWLSAKWIPDQPNPAREYDVLWAAAPDAPTTAHALYADAGQGGCEDWIHWSECYGDPDVRDVAFRILGTVSQDLTCAEWTDAITPAP